MNIARPSLHALVCGLLSAGSALAQTDAATSTKSFEGLNFGVGLALIFPFDRDGGANVEAEIDGNNIVRITRESKRTPAILLESHYLFKKQASTMVRNSVTGAEEKSGLWFCPVGNTCSHGPFVAIQASSESGATISAYGLGWMLAYKRNGEATDSSSWNIGLGYVVRTGVQQLGDGLSANQALPAGDKLRYKSISQPGWMWMSSFSF
jgi:hypothetical protein